MDGLCTVATLGLFTGWRPPSFARRGWLEALGSSRRAVEGHRIGSWLSVAFPAPQRGWFNTPGLLRGAIVQAQSESGVTRPVRGERLASSTCRVSGSATAGVAMRRSAGQSRVVALSNVGVYEGSFDAPSNTQMEPSRPTILCDPVTEARGSFATLGIYRLVRRVRAIGEAPCRRILYTQRRLR